MSPGGMSVTTFFIVFLPAVSCTADMRVSEDIPVDVKELVQVVAALRRNLGAVTVTVNAEIGVFQFSTLEYLQSTLGDFRISRYGVISSELTISIFRKPEGVFAPSSKSYWDPEFRYIFYFSYQSPQVEQIFQYLWSNYHVYRVFIIVQGNDTVTTFDPVVRTIKSYNLLSGDMFTVKMPDWNQSDFYAVYAGMYVDKVLRNSRSYLVDRLTLEAITERLNLKLRMTNTTDGPNKFGFRSKNGSFHGTFKELTMYRANMSGNVHFMKMYDIQDELTYSVHCRADKICIGVPKTEKIPRFVQSFQAFNITVWLSIAVIYTTTAMALKFFRFYFSKANNRLLSDVDLPLITFGICLGLPVEYVPKLNFEKLILSAVLLVSFVVVSVVQSTLNAILSSPPEFYKIPNTREEFNEQKVEVWTSSSDLIDSFRAAGYTGVRFHLKTLEEQKMDIVKRVYEYGILEKVAAVVDPKSLEFMHGKSKLTQACPVQYNVAYVFQRGSPFEEPINRVLSALWESGMMLKWDRYVYEQPLRSMQFAAVLRENVDLKPLTMEDVGVPLYFACCGYLSAFAAFVVEFATRWWYKKELSLFR